MARPWTLTYYLPSEPLTDDYDAVPVNALEALTGRLSRRLEYRVAFDYDRALWAIYTRAGSRGPISDD